MVILLMGVSGAGKTLIGKQLASELQWEFADADDYHERANVEKMRSGIPLTDADRASWLQKLHDLIATWIAANRDGVLACSALKEAYRKKLVVGPEVRVVYLRGSRQVLQERLRGRKGHFMTEQLLDSQLATLEEPRDAVVVDVEGTPGEMVTEIRSKLEFPYNART